MADRLGRRRRKMSTGGISRIWIRGYKSLAEECSLEIRPLTLLAGANSSGKSSALQPLLLLKQTLEASYDPGAILLNGPNVQFTSAEQLLSKLTSGGRSHSFTIGVELEDKRSVAQTFKKPKRRGFQIADAVYSFPDGRTTRIAPGMASEDLLPLLPEEVRNLLMEWATRDGETLRAAVARRRCFLGLEAYFDKDGDEAGRATKASSFSMTPDEDIEPYLRNVMHVPGLRGNPERTYKITAIGSEFPGTFDDYVASVVSHWQATQDNRLNDLRNALEALSLTWKVEARQVDDVQVELRVGRLPRSARGGSQDMVSITDVGFGVSQTLPVLVALLAAEPGQLVYLEQPELHLHPRAQVALARVLADAASRGVRVVAETHSSLLLLAIQTMVAEGGLSPAMIKLHWFTRRDDGVTEVNSAELDEAGTFGAWPEDFADVTLDAERRFLEAIESRLHG